MRLPRALALAGAAALLAGCGGSSAPQSPAASILPAARARLDSSAAAWMAPDAKSRDLLYVSDLGTQKVDVFSYPAGELKGQLKGFKAPHGLCVDKAGDVYIANEGASELVEYAHGGTKPLRRIADPGFTPTSCDINPKNGDLAVAHDPLGSGPGGVLVFKHATGTPKVYSTPNVYRYYFVGYDAGGDLFVDGTDIHVAYEIAELPAGQHAFAAFTLNQHIDIPGGVHWDGTNLVIGDQVSLFGPSTIYEFSVSGLSGTEVGTTPLSDSCDVLGFWLAGKRVIVANVCSPNVMYFAYPAGGMSTKTISAGLSGPVGVAVSPAN